MSAISKEAVAGVWPIDRGEAHITQRFPSISSTGVGRFLGTIYSLPFPIGFVVHILTVPLPVLVAVGMFLATGFRRYQLTSQCVRIQQGLRESAGPEVALADLEDVRLERRPGQRYYRAADLALISGGKVALTLPGVPNPEAFRHTILEARTALLQVRECLKAEAAAAAAS